MRSTNIQFMDTELPKPMRGKGGYSFTLFVDGAPALTVGFPTMDQTEEAKENLREALDAATIIRRS